MLTQGQALEALRALAHVVHQHDVRSYIDIPVGDGCFSHAALARLRQARPTISYVGLEIVKSLVDDNLVSVDNNTRLVHADVATLPQLPGPTADLIFSRQMMQHVRRRSSSACPRSPPPHQIHVLRCADVQPRRPPRAQPHLQVRRAPRTADHL